MVVVWREVDRGEWRGAGGGAQTGRARHAAAGEGRAGGRYVSAVAADGDARNAGDLQIPSAPPPTTASSRVLAYLCLCIHISAFSIARQLFDTYMLHAKLYYT